MDILCFMLGFLVSFTAFVFVMRRMNANTKKLYEDRFKQIGCLVLDHSDFGDLNVFLEFEDKEWPSYATDGSLICLRVEKRDYLSK